MNPQEHFNAIVALISEGHILRWKEQHDPNLPLTANPFLSGQEKFDAMLEVLKAIKRVDDFLFTSWNVNDRNLEPTEDIP